MTDEQIERQRERAQQLFEWLEFFHDAMRFGETAEKASRIADVLVYGYVRH